MTATLEAPLGLGTQKLRNYVVERHKELTPFSFSPNALDDQSNDFAIDRHSYI